MKRFMDLLEAARDLFLKKNKGYAGGNSDPFINFKSSLGFGVKPSIGCLIRISDKWARIHSLVAKPSNDEVGENIKDTLFDMAVYCLICICLIEDENISNSKKGG
jgi:hypothetical protein